VLVPAISSDSGLSTDKIQNVKIAGTDADIILVMELASNFRATPR
jgi:hypothetical protein